MMTSLRSWLDKFVFILTGFAALFLMLYVPDWTKLRLSGWTGFVLVLGAYSAIGAIQRHLQPRGFARVLLSWSRVVCICAGVLGVTPELSEMYSDLVQAKVSPPCVSPSEADGVQKKDVDVWDRMDKYASVFGFALTLVGLVIAMLTGWVITLAKDARVQIDEVSKAIGLESKVAKVEEIHSLLSAASSLHHFLLSNPPEKSTMVSTALNGFNLAEAALNAGADLEQSCNKLVHIRSALRNAFQSPHISCDQKRCVRQALQIGLKPLIVRSLEPRSLLYGAQGNSYRQALSGLLTELQ